MCAEWGADMPLSRGVLLERTDPRIDELMEDKDRDDSEHEATGKFYTLGRKVQRAFFKERKLNRKGVIQEGNGVKLT